MHHPSRATTMFMAMARPNKSGPPSRIMPPATSQKLLRSRPKMWQKAQDVNPALKFLRSQSDRVSVGCAGTHQIHGSPIIDRLGSDLFEARTKDRTWGCPLVSGTKVLVVVPWVLWVASWGHPLQDLFRHIQWRVDQIGIRGIWKAMLTHWALHHITWAIPEYLEFWFESVLLEEPVPLWNASAVMAVLSVWMGITCHPRGCQDPRFRSRTFNLDEVIIHFTSSLTYWMKALGIKPVLGCLFPPSFRYLHVLMSSFPSLRETTAISKQATYTLKLESYSYISAYLC